MMSVILRMSVARAELPWRRTENKIQKLNKWLSLCAFKHFTYMISDGEMFLQKFRSTLKSNGIEKMLGTRWLAASAPTLTQVPATVSLYSIDWTSLSDCHLRCTWLAWPGSHIVLADDSVPLKPFYRCDDEDDYLAPDDDGTNDQQPPAWAYGSIQINALTKVDFSGYLFSVKNYVVGRLARLFSWFSNSSSDFPIRCSSLSTDTLFNNCFSIIPFSCSKKAQDLLSWLTAPRILWILSRVLPRSFCCITNPKIEQLITFEWTYSHSLLYQGCGFAETSENCWCSQPLWKCNHQKTIGTISGISGPSIRHIKTNKYTIVIETTQ